MKLDGLGGAAAAFGNPQAKKDDDIGKTAFLELLVTQLSNQDPMSPSDPTQFVTQLATFTSLEQLVNVNQGIDVLALSQTAATSAQMVSFVGKHVSYDGDVVTLGQAGEQADLGFRLKGDTKTTTVTVRDADGSVVRTLDLGGRSEGPHTVTLDGLDDDGNPLPAGQYSFEVVGTDKDGQQVQATSSSEGLVTGVIFENGYPELVVDGQTLTLGQVTKVVDPEPADDGGQQPTTDGGRDDATAADDNPNS